VTSAPALCHHPAVRASVLVVAMAVAACSGARGEEETVRTHQELLAGDTPVRIVNATRHVACFVYLARNGEEDWGTDWLGRVEILDTGAVKQVSVAAGTYQLKVEICGHRVLAQQWDVEVSGPREIVLHEGTEPDSAPPEGFTRLSVRAVDIITLGAVDAGASSSPEPTGDPTDPAPAAD
jgi:hypothetical protein